MGNIDYGPRLFSRLRAHTEQFVAAEGVREATWTEATTNDRLAAAFAELRARGVVANAGMGSTLQDAWAYVGIECGKSDADLRGAVLFHDEDVIDAIEGRQFHLAFGAFDGDGMTRDARSRQLAQEIVEVLASHGVACRWSGAVHERIVIPPFEWRFRRTTTAPAHDRVAPASKPSLLGWFFGSRPAAPVLADGIDPDVFASNRRRFVEGGHAVLVRAPMSTGFDLRRSHRLRSGFEALSGGLRAHACHLGLPFAFVPCDDYTMFAAMPAIENITDEAVPLRERGVRAVQASIPPG